MKKILSVLLSILFAFALLGTLLLGIVREHVKPSTISDLASEILKPVAYEKNSSGLFYPDEWNVVQVVDYEIPEDLDFSNIDLENLDIAEIVDTVAEAYGVDIDSEFVAEVLSDPETTELVNEYTNEIVDYMTGKTTELNIDPVKLEKVINKSIDKYEEKTGEVVDRTGLNESINEGVKAAVPEITTSLDVVKEENAETLEVVKLCFEILSLKTLLICVAVCVIIALLIFVINRNIFRTLRFVSIPGFIVGVILFGSAISIGVLLPMVMEMLKAELALPGSIINAVVKIVSIVISNIKFTGIITILISVVAGVLGFTLYKTKTEVVEVK